MVAHYILFTLYKNMVNTSKGKIMVYFMMYIFVNKIVS